MEHWFFNRALRILLFTNTLILVSSAMLGPIYALFVEEVGGNLLDASITFAIFALATGITTLIFGKLSDKIRHKSRFIVIGYFIVGIGFFLYSFVGSVFMLLIVQAIIGFGDAVYTPSFDALYSKHTAKTKAGREWATWEAFNHFSVAIGAVIGGLIVNFLGFNVLFYVMAALSLLSAVYIFFLKKGSL